MGESNEDIKALIMTADAFEGPGILVPTTNADLFRWCLERDLHVVQLIHPSASTTGTDFGFGGKCC